MQRVPAGSGAQQHKGIDAGGHGEDGETRVSSLAPTRLRGQGSSRPPDPDSGRLGEDEGESVVAVGPAGLIGEAGVS